MTLKELRKVSKIKQKDIAKKLNKTRNAIGLYESGKRKPNIELIPTLAEIFKTSIENVVFAIINTAKQGEKKSYGN